MTFTYTIPLTESVDRGETSRKIMEAILFTAYNDVELAEYIWREGSAYILGLVYERARTQGATEGIDLLWGSSVPAEVV